MPKFTKKRVVAIVAVSMLAIGGGAAYAYWTNTGSGTGTASTGTNVAITVNQTGSTLSNLYPGGPASTLSGAFTNSNASKVFVHQVTASLDSVTGGAGDLSKPACTVADFQLGNNPATVDAEVDPGTSGTWSGITVALKDTATNQDNCKNATLHLNYSSN